MGQKLKNEELKRLNTEEYKKADKSQVCVVLDNVRSLHNVGSVFRTADAFRLETLWLCGVTGTPPNKEIEKTALGATSTVKWNYEKNTADAIKKLREDGYSIFSVEQTKGSTMLHQVKERPQKTALIFGNEIYGVEQEIIDQSDGVIEIPQLGSKHSLNISVSAGIVLWELLRDNF
jgi:tRNA G18 (ribose-2'-O)-methylase SpoU